MFDLRSFKTIILCCGEWFWIRIVYPLRCTHTIFIRNDARFSELLTRFTLPSISLILCYPFMSPASVHLKRWRLRLDLRKKLFNLYFSKITIISECTLSTAAVTTVVHVLHFLKLEKKLIVHVRRSVQFRKIVDYKCTWILPIRESWNCKCTSFFITWINLKTKCT